MGTKSTEMLYRELTMYKKPKETNDIYSMECPWCNTKFSFKEEELYGKIIKCPNCRYEEVFLRCNFTLR